MSIETRLGRLEEDMGTLKLTSRRLVERTSHMNSAVSPGGWISEAFEELNLRVDRIEQRLDEQREILTLILSRLSPENNP